MHLLLKESSVRKQSTLNIFTLGNLISMPGMKTERSLRRIMSGHL
jgi:hypothetical protein